MKMYYSKTTGGFYDKKIHGDNFPVDAVEISSEYRWELIVGQNSGKRIVANEAGYPVLADPLQPTQEQIIALLSDQIQKRLDDFSATRKYDNVVSLSKYTDITDAEIALLPTEDQAAVTRYRAECRHLLLKVAQTWAVSERILSEVVNNQRPAPASIADFEAELPALTWPA